MKKQVFPKTFMAILGVATLMCSALSSFSQDAPSVSATVTTRSQIAPALSYGAANVLKLAQANVGEETILAYVQKSGQSYGNLGASEIIYLHQQGVSDRVVTTMLDQEKQLRDVAAAQPTTPQTVAAIQPTVPVSAAPQYPQPYVVPTATYVQPVPNPVIVMHDTSPRLIDYGIYPRYGYGYYPSYGYGYGYRNYGYCYPSASFSIGFSSHGFGGGFHTGGFHGGHHR